MKKEAVGGNSTIEVAKIHFLIHPGYIFDPRNYSDLAAREYRPYAKKGQALMDRYIAKARQLPKDHIMIAMLHANFHNLLNDFRNQKDYIQKLSELKNILGNRLIALSDNYVIEEPESYIRARQLAEDKGYFFTEKVLTEAYDEALQSCVVKGAQVANNALGLKRKTIVRPEFTEAPDISQERIGNLSHYSRLRFVPPRRRSRV